MKNIATQFAELKQRLIDEGCDFVEEGSYIIKGYKMHYVSEEDGLKMYEWLKTQRAIIERLKR